MIAVKVEKLGRNFLRSYGTGMQYSYNNEIISTDKSSYSITKISEDDGLSHWFIIFANFTTSKNCISRVFQP